MRQEGRLAEALVQFEHALRLAPELPRAHAGYGYTLALLGRLREAIDAYHEAVRLQPGYWRAWSNLGAAYMKTGQADLAVECYQRAALNPDFDLHLFALNYHSERTPDDVFAAHLEWGRRNQQKISATPFRNTRSARRKLRIGYVSGDFWSHAVAICIEAVLAAHDHSAFEIVCYDNSGRSDQTTARLQGLSSRWRSIAGLSDAQAGALIRKDRIDILVDLSGHTDRNRMALFARRRAPVQANYHGYPNTTGLPAIDYRITDAVADPPGLTEALHTEKLVRLPRCFLCYSPPPEAPAVSSLPVRTKGWFTFGSFSNPAKWNDTVLSAWAAILRRTPRSRLLLHHSLAANETSVVYDALRARVLGLFQRGGIAPDRIGLIGFLEPPQHLALYNEIDLALDPFPYNGATATCEALWMGVPVVTLEGATHAARVGLAILTSIGLDRFVAPSIEDYVEIAVRAAARPAALSRLRSATRARMAGSPLMDGPGLARALEQAYRQMWQRWCGT